MCDGLETWWSIDSVNEGEKLYKLVIQYENMDPSLRYDEQENE